MRPLFWQIIVFIGLLILFIAGYWIVPGKTENYDNDAYILRQLEDVNSNLKDIKELLGRLNDCCRNNGR